MDITKKQLHRLGHLCRIKINADQEDGLLLDLERIVGFVKHLNEVDTTHAEPFVSPAASQMPMREDVVSDAGYAPKILKNAPQAEFDMFVVPKVVE